ncbi:MAG: chemotaxis protein CheW [Desulfococcaceae bacterium]
MRELMLFQAGGYRLALELGAVRGIHPLGDLQPAGPGRCRLEGREMALHDLAIRFGTPRADAAHPRVIRMEVAGEPHALRVDAVDRVARVAEDRIEDLPPAFSGRPAHWFPAVARMGDSLALVLSPEGMLGIRPAPAGPVLAAPEAAAAVAELVSATRLTEIVAGAVERHLVAGLRARLRALPGRLFRTGVR